MAEINLNDLNEEVRLKPLSMITKAEYTYHARVADVAERVVNDDEIKLILLAGPSGSGKTTTANLIADSIKALGDVAMVVSLDDFYRDHDDEKYPKLSDGHLDYECPEALNLPKLKGVLKKIINGESFEIPKYEFKSGSAIETRTYPPIGHGCVIIEGLHALNPVISDDLPSDKILKIFVSVSTNINLDGERIISGRKLRFVRRLVRDSIFRGSDASRTLSMWRHVLEAEDVYLYPYKSTADIAFDTFHPFEVGAMKTLALQLISQNLAQENIYAGTVYRAMGKVREIDRNLIPDDSLIREFIAGGIYENVY